MEEWKCKSMLTGNSIQLEHDENPQSLKCGLHRLRWRFLV